VQKVRKVRYRSKFVEHKRTAQIANGIAFLMLVLCLPMANAQDIYRWVGPDGRTQYSDQPHPGAEKLTIPEFPPPQPPRKATAKPGAADDPAAHVYRSLSIVKPAPREIVHDNQGNVEVLLTVDPALHSRRGDRIQLLLDGHAQGDPTASLAQTLHDVERGEHTATAQVVDQRGRVLIASEPVLFLLYIASPLFHPPRPDAPHTGVQQAPRAPMLPRMPRAPHAPFRPAPN
jgi:hypothetical protein